VLPNKGLEWTSAVSVQRASARSPLNPVLGGPVKRGVGGHVTDDERTQLLNVDLDIVADAPLTPLVEAFGDSALCRYYESQRILEPPPEGERPRYLVTANALVWRDAFQRVGGFCEDFRLAAGEDVDLGLRLRELGTLAYARDAAVLHVFEPSVVAFWRRFHRYGIGNHQVGQLHGLDLAPRLFAPTRKTPFNWTAATVQYAALASGYRSADRSTR